MYNGVRSKSWPMYGVINPLILHETGLNGLNSVTASGQLIYDSRITSLF